MASLARLQHSIAVLAIGGASLAGAPAAAADCPNANAHPDDISVSDYSASLACLVNEQRQDWGRAPLVPQRNLARAAAWHASDMIRGDYFAHTEPDGTTLADRLDKANFIPSSDRWRAGENLAAGEAAEGTPAAIVSGWMNSREHRINLLDPSYTMVGIGIARGWPSASGVQNDSMTIDMDLGWRAPTRRG
jgi:uncharacterized protein YkwD